MDEVTGFEGIYFQVNETNKDDAQYYANRMADMLNSDGANQWEVKIQTDSFNFFYFLAEPKDKKMGVPDVWNVVNKIRSDARFLVVNPAFKFRTDGEQALINGGLVGCDTPHLKGTKENANWHLDSVHAHEAFALDKGVGNKGKGIRVGLIDTGYRSHPLTFGSKRLLYRMGANVWNGEWDAWSDTADIGGGMHSTGTGSLIMGAEKKVPNMLTGTAPEAELVPIRASLFVIVPPVNLIKAIEHAINTNCHVISMSLGWLPYGAGVDMAEKYLQYAASQRGIIPIAAGAQPGAFLDMLGGTFPGTSSWTIGVAANDIKGNPWLKQVSGTHIDVSAPGASVINADYKVMDFAPPGFSQYGNKAIHQIKFGCGTSFATAITAGAAATWLSYRGVNQLKDTYGTNLFKVFFYELLNFGLDTDNWNPETGFGKGKLNMRKLLERQGKPAPTVREVDDFFVKEQHQQNTILSWISKLIGRLKVDNLLDILHYMIKPLSPNLNKTEVYRLLEVNGSEMLMQFQVNTKFREAFFQLATTPGAVARTNVLNTLKGVVSDDLAKNIGLI